MDMPKTAPHFPADGWSLVGQANDLSAYYEVHENGFGILLPVIFISLSYASTMTSFTDDLEAGSKREVATEESVETTVDEPSTATNAVQDVKEKHAEKHEHGAKWKANEVHTLPPKSVFFCISVALAKFTFQ